MGRIVPGSKPVVLVVEDEMLTRLNAAMIVEAAGYEAIAVSNGDDAIGLLEQRDDVRAVFTDIQMPGWTDGLGSVRIVRDRWPAVGILVTSGRTIMTEADLPKGIPFLPKPYLPTQIEAALRQLIG